MTHHPAWDSKYFVTLTVPLAYWGSVDYWRVVVDAFSKAERRHGIRLGRIGLEKLDIARDTSGTVTVTHYARAE